MKECVKKIVEYFINNVPQRQIARLCKSHHLQCITSSKDSEKLEKSLCVRDKAEDLCWRPVVFRPQTTLHPSSQRCQVTKYKYFVTYLSRNFGYLYFTGVIIFQPTFTSTPYIFTKLSVLSTPYILKIASLLSISFRLVSFRLVIVQKKKKNLSR